MTQSFDFQSDRVRINFNDPIRIGLTQTPALRLRHSVVFFHYSLM
jgi:hypothetical protein